MITKDEFESQVWQFVTRLKDGAPEVREVQRLIFEASAWAVACGANESSVGFWSADESAYRDHYSRRRRPSSTLPSNRGSRSVKIHWPARWNAAIPACGAGAEPGQFKLSDKVMLVSCGNCLRLPDVKKRTELKRVS